MGLTKPCLGKPEAHVWNSAQLVKQLEAVTLALTDGLISLDVVSLFTRVPISVTLELFPEATVKLFEFVLTSTYFSYKGFFFEQVEGVAMGFPLSPVIANFFMEFFEQRALEQSPLKPLLYHRYVDDTLLIWNYGQAALEDFIDILNNNYESIKFTVEQEQDGKLPFLDILLMRRSGGKLS